MSVLAHNNAYETAEADIYSDTKAAFLYETEMTIIELMQEPMDILALKAIEKDVKLFYEPTKIKISLKVDQEKIRQSIIHVVKNALKFSSPSASIYVMTGLDFNGDFYIRVDDEGTGIATEVLNRILEPFAKVENGIETRIGSNACGLNVVNAYLKMHFGYLRIQSQVSRGTSVTLTLPKSCLLSR
ncbi:MAG: ATP-binding protein [Hyphomicrobiales bacterium]